MKKIISLLSVLIIIFSLIILISLNININNNIKRNQNVNKKIESLFENKEEILIEDISNLPSIEINNKDYIGIIKIPKINISIPIEKNNNNNFIKIKSANFNNNIYLTNLRDSAKNYRKLEENDEIIILDLRGNELKHNITKIKKIKNKKYLKNIKNKLIIKDYYALTYTVVYFEEDI